MRSVFVHAQTTLWARCVSERRVSGRLRLEPWGVGYLGSLQDAAGFGATTDHGGSNEHAEPLDADALQVELPMEEWTGLVGRAPAHVPKVLFLDGVRRVEARLLLEDHEPAFGALGSCAVGAVVCNLDGGVADYDNPPRVERWCTFAAGRSDLPDVILTAADGTQRLRYRVAASPETDADAPLRLLQSKMRLAEANLAAHLSSELGEGLLITDGPRPLLAADERVLGYLKTVQSQRLPAAALSVVRSLDAGQRSPLYLVGRGATARFEWYVRLRDPRPWLHTLAGNVRLQAHAGSNVRAQLHRAQALADWSAVTLPRFATRSHQDPRAPQQLLPVMALEQMLRRRLGNASLLRRRLIASLATEEGDRQHAA